MHELIKSLKININLLIYLMETINLLMVLMTEY